MRFLLAHLFMCGQRRSTRVVTLNTRFHSPIQFSKFSWTTTQSLSYLKSQKANPETYYAMAEEFRVLRPYEFHCQLISKGQRADGRILDEFRDIKLEFNAIRTADSSSLVKLGNTSLVCGCTAQLVNVHEKLEDDERIKVNVELPPICSNSIGNRTQHTAQLLTKMLKNILDDTNCLDSTCLYVKDLESYWYIDVEVICLNYDGCLLDGAVVAVLAALKSLNLVSKSVEVPARMFQLNSLPICSSFAVIGDHFICDPNLEEEAIAESTYSITYDAISGGKCHINKIGGKSISMNKLFKCIEFAKGRSAQLQQLINDKMPPVIDDKQMDCS